MQLEESLLQEIGWNITFSETLLLLPFSSSGAIQGRVPRTPPVTKVLRLIFDKPKSPTWERKFLSLLNTQKCDIHTDRKILPDTVYIPCILDVKDLSSLLANCHILSQNAQCFLSANIPFQKLHPLQLSASCDDQDTLKTIMLRFLNQIRNKNNL